MSKKMKGVALDSSSYGTHADARARFKHQALMVDYQELQKETGGMRSKLETMKQRKLTLLAEVRFLRRRYKYLLVNKAAKPLQGQQVVQQQYFETRRKSTTKEKRYRQKEAELQNIVPSFDVNKKERGFTVKETYRRIPSPVLDLNQKDRIHSGKQSTFRNMRPIFDLNQERTFGGKEAAMFRSPTPIQDLNQTERLLYGGKEATLRNPAPSFDLNQMNGTYIGGEDAVVQNRAPIFDLNQISGEEEELQNNYEPLRMEEPKKLLIRGGTDEPLNDLKLSLCRNVGNVPNRAGKRKISWQDQVALKVV